MNRKGAENTAASPQEGWGGGPVGASPPGWNKDVDAGVEEEGPVKSEWDSPEHAHPGREKQQRPLDPNEEWPTTECSSFKAAVSMTERGRGGGGQLSDSDGGHMGGVVGSGASSGAGSGEEVWEGEG